MNCERIREQIPECLAGRLDPAAREKLIDHLETCSACRAEVAELKAVWRGLETMKQNWSRAPADAQARFLEILAAYQEGHGGARSRMPCRKSIGQAGCPPAGVAGARSRRAAGVRRLLGGRYLRPAAAGGNPEMAQLRGQVESLRQLVALSLLQEQSPSARLRGVTYSDQIAQPDRQVEQALLHAVNHDTNVNVRLSAVDALQKFAAIRKWRARWWIPCRCRIRRWCRSR